LFEKIIPGNIPETNTFTFHLYQLSLVTSSKMPPVPPKNMDPKKPPSYNPKTIVIIKTNPNKALFLEEIQNKTTNIFAGLVLPKWLPF